MFVCSYVEARREVHFSSFISNRQPLHACDIWVQYRFRFVRYNFAFACSHVFLSCYRRLNLHQYPFAQLTPAAACHCDRRADNSGLPREPLTAPRGIVPHAFGQAISHCISGV